MAGFSAINVLISVRFKFLYSVWAVIMARRSAPLTASCNEFAFSAPKVWLRADGGHIERLGVCEGWGEKLAFLGLFLDRETAFA